MTKKQFPRVQVSRLLLAAVFLAVCPQQEVAATGNGGSPSEPIPRQSVCATGIWVIQQATALNKAGNRVFQLFGQPRSKAAVFQITIETDPPAEMLLAGAPLQPGRVEVPTSRTVDLEFKPGGPSRTKAKLTFFGEPSCSEVIAVAFQ